MYVKKKLDETDEIYNKRKNFINIIKSNKNLNEKEILILSNIWINITILKCTYTLNIMKKIEELLTIN